METTRAVFLDMDGTIFASETLCVRVVGDTLRHFSLPVPPVETLRLCNGPTVRGMAELVNVPEDIIPAFTDWMIRYEMDIIPSCQALYDGVREMLLALSRHALLFVASNGAPGYYNKSLQYFDLFSLFTDVPQAPDDLTKGQRIMRDMQKWHVTHAVMIGDRAPDLQGARDSGIPFVAATYGYGPQEEWAAADAFAQSTAEAASETLRLLGVVNHGLTAKTR